jgi:hypothetical protein
MPDGWSDPVKFKGLADEAKMPESRQNLQA